MLQTTAAPRICYPYEEFADHVRAMKTVRNWEYTARFGHLGTDQTSRANNARVVEYFSDSYGDQAEAVGKAEIFISIYEYLGCHAGLFSKKGFMERVEGSVFFVEPSLLRAVHQLFTVASRPASVDPKRVLNLARAVSAIEAPI
jgi:hypothetical protein